MQSLKVKYNNEHSISKRSHSYKNMHLSSYELMRIRDSKRRKLSYLNDYCFAAYTHD